MAVTPVDTSGFSAMQTLSGYSYDQLAQMFETAESPAVDSVVVLDMGSGAGATVLSAPGAGKSLYIWAAGCCGNATGAATTHLALCDGALLTGSFASVPGSGSGANLASTLIPIRHKLTANTLMSVFNLSAGTLAFNIRLLYCVI